MKQLSKLLVAVLFINFAVLSGLSATILNRVGKIGIGKKTIPEYLNKSVTVELWNKTSKPIRAEITEVDGHIDQEKSELIQPNGLTYREKEEKEGKEGISLASPFFINVYNDKNQVTDIYRVDPKGKTVYIRFKSEKGKDILGPQTGALIGFVKSTDTGLSLRNNISDKDIRKLTDAQVAATKERAGEPKQADINSAQGMLGIAKNCLPSSITKDEAYKILKLKPNASAEEIAKAWKSQLLLWHPDKNPGQKVLATEVTQFINAAKTKLGS